MGNSENTFELQSSDFEEDRYSRLRLIPWWDQNRLKDATIMVVGAGAIGNELIKNLTLLGIGRILIFDMDAIENTNLTARFFTGQKMLVAIRQKLLPSEQWRSIPM